MRENRLLFFQCALFVILVCLALSLFNLQVLHGNHYRALSEKNRIRLIRIESPRGSIYDRNGVALAKTRPSFDIFVVPEDFNPKYTAFLARALNMEAGVLHEKITHLQDAPFVPVLLRRDVMKEVVFKIEEKKPVLTGVITEVGGLRFYPHDDFSSHVVGYLGKITKEEYEVQGDEPIHHLNDWVGRSGVEKVFDRFLQGEDGGRQIEVNNRGRQVRVLGEKEPVAGSDLTLTIDARLQRVVAESLGGKKGSVCLLDLDQGEVLALASKPDFDPNIFVSPAQSAERMSLIMNQGDTPLLNRGVSAGVPPGSVFKLVTALAALETGKITPETTLGCSGSFRLTPNSRSYKCWNDSGHGFINLYEAIERSCNVYFYQAGLRTGAKNLAYYARELGLGKMIEIELPSVAEGFIPDEEWKRKQLHDAWYDGETLNFAIGQGFVLVTPLQLVRLVGIIAKEGEIPEVHIVKNGHVKPKRHHASIHPENIRLLKKAMLRVVNSDHGTGQLARVDFFKIAAKTGTAQVPPKEPHSWFCGFFPYENPRYALVVFIEHGGSGGYHAAPIAKKIVMGMKDLNFFSEASHDASRVS